EVGWMSVQRILMVVVFPAPLGPSRPKTSPFLTLKLTSLNAVTVFGFFRKSGPSLTVKDFARESVSRSSIAGCFGLALGLLLTQAHPECSLEVFRPKASSSRFGRNGNCLSHWAAFLRVLDYSLEPSDYLPGHRSRFALCYGHSVNLDDWNDFCHCSG